MQNLLLPSLASVAKNKNYFGRPLAQLIARLDTLLLILKNCKTDVCRKPWDVIFPKDTVNNVEQAMAAKYDDFFKKQPKISFRGCKSGHVLANEGPSKPNVWKGS
jgi:N-acetylglucosamine-6-sulfatase